MQNVLGSLLCFGRTHGMSSGLTDLKISKRRNPYGFVGERDNASQGISDEVKRFVVYDLKNC